ncbi:MAG: S-methyl-5-thioribose-1-phosphate isomerase [Candidatus Margulisiibacteriota bacterium]
MIIQTFKIKQNKVYTIDQTLIPEKLDYIELDSPETTFRAIRDMIVRGAPAIGIAGAFGMSLAARDILHKQKKLNARLFLSELTKSAEYLKSARPTAVNLAWAVDRMLKLANHIIIGIALNSIAKDEEKKDNKGVPTTHIAQELHCTAHPKVSHHHDISEVLFQESVAILKEDIKLNESIGEHGAKLIDSGMNILTHCNAGALATGGHGTALGIIRTAYTNGKKIHIYADETRPRLQGARLTVWELQQENIPVTLISDNMAGYLMQQNKINCVIVGADRITSNGDVANKIGTYSVAVLAKHHNIPFYVAAPYSTIDASLASGKQIPIEERDKNEVLKIGESAIARPKTQVYNPAFDVTPAELITGIVTESGVFKYPYKF